MLDLHVFALFKAHVGQVREHLNEMVKIANAVLLQHLLQHVASAEMEFGVFVVLVAPQRCGEHAVVTNDCDAVRN